MMRIALGQQVYVMLMSMVCMWMLPSCKSKKFNLESNQQLTEFGTGTQQKMAKSAFNFEHMSLKIKSSYSENNGEQSFIMNVKMIRDSAIWVSVSAFGIEVARALVTNDSFKLIDRIQKQYMSGTIDQLKKYTVQEYSLLQLQDLLIGNALFSPESYNAKTDDLRKAHLFFQNENLSNSLRITEGFRSKISELVNTLNTQNATITYDEFTRVKKFGTLPTSISILMNGNGHKMEFKMNYVTISTDPIDNLPFSVPDKYAKRM